MIHGPGEGASPAILTLKRLLHDCRWDGRSDEARGDKKN
jgi:hypothetical protein